MPTNHIADEPDQRPRGRSLHVHFALTRLEDNRRARRDGWRHWASRTALPLSSETLTAGDVYRALWRHKFLVAVLTAVFVGTAWYLTSRQTRTYEAATLVRVQERGPDAGSASTALQASQTLALTYATIIGEGGSRTRSPGSSPSATARAPRTREQAPPHSAARGRQGTRRRRLQARASHSAVSAEAGPWQRRSRR